MRDLVIVCTIFWYMTVFSYSVPLLVYLHWSRSLHVCGGRSRTEKWMSLWALIVRITSSCQVGSSSSSIHSVCRQGSSLCHQNIWGRIFSFVILHPFLLLGLSLSSCMSTVFTEIRLKRVAIWLYCASLSSFQCQSNWSGDVSAMSHFLTREECNNDHTQDLNMWTV